MLSKLVQRLWVVREEIADRGVGATGLELSLVSIDLCGVRLASVLLARDSAKAGPISGSSKTGGRVV